MSDPRHHEHGERDHRGWRVSPGPDGRGAPEPPAKPRKPWRPSVPWVIGVVLLLAVNWLVVSQLPAAKAPVPIPYSPTFLTQVQAGNVESISSQGLDGPGRLPHARSATRRTTTDGEPRAGSRPRCRPSPTPSSSPRCCSPRASWSTPSLPTRGARRSSTLLLSLLPTLLIVVGCSSRCSAARRAAGGRRARRLRTLARAAGRALEQRITFDDVAGIDEAKAELAEIVDFLRDPDKYRRLGGRIPRGVLLTGPPGTGKTLLARALAGEAEVPFFSISASEFVELFVGVGASRVRDLFQQAKEAAPAIIFIDELDAIGRSRAGAIGGLGGGHDEREQTLNQILTEMDGFDPSIGVIVPERDQPPRGARPGAAAARPLRPARRAAAAGHGRAGAGSSTSTPARCRSPTTSTSTASPRRRAGMVGADLANVVNEAALLAARREHDAVTMADFHDALEKLVLGTERRILLSPAERRRTAYHEAGHAIVGMLTPGADPVRKVSIIPRGIALGVTLSAPEADRFSYDQPYLLAKIKVALGGRVAEEIVFGNVTTGAQNDIKQVTELARNMVGLWGMSDTIGPVAVCPKSPRPRCSQARARPPQATAAARRRRGPPHVDDAHDDVSRLLRGPPRQARRPRPRPARARDPRRARSLRRRGHHRETRTTDGRVCRCPRRHLTATRDTVAACVSPPRA